MARCELKAANGLGDVPCDEWRCTYWRLVDHLGVELDDRQGCAIQYFRLLEGEDSAVAAWLLSVKERVEEQERKAS